MKIFTHKINNFIDMWNDMQFQIFLFIDLFRPISTYFEKISCTFLQYFAQTFSLSCKRTLLTQLPVLTAQVASV